MTDVSLLPMEDTHIDSVNLIEAKSFSAPWSLNMFAEILENPVAEFYVAADAENKICGFAGMYIIGNEAQILNIAVDPDFRRLGIGRALLRKLIDRCGDRGVSSVFLEVRESNNPARSLYRSFGFEFCGMRKRYYTNPVEDAFVMQKILKSE